MIEIREIKPKQTLNQIENNKEKYNNEIPFKINLISNQFMLWDLDLSFILYNEFGFFGQPIGVRKITPGSKFDSPLLLSYFETIYLLEKKIIEVFDEWGKVRKEDVLKICVENYENFLYVYSFYNNLRELNYVVRPGMKFGGDFIIYEKGPGLEHSKWVVHVVENQSKFQVIKLVQAGRLAGNVKKDYMMAYKDAENQIQYLKLKRLKI